VPRRVLVAVCSEDGATFMDVETAGSETSPRFSEALAVKVREGAKSTGPDEREKDEETRADVF